MWTLAIRGVAPVQRAGSGERRAAILPATGASVQYWYCRRFMMMVLRLRHSSSLLYDTYDTERDLPESSERKYLTGVSRCSGNFCKRNT